MHDVFSGRRVLVVEDEMVVLMNIERALDDLGGIETLAAATVDDALALLETMEFDLAILDVNLDGQPSYPVAEALALRAIPFVFSTGYGQHRIEARFRDRPVLRKPYSQSQFSTTLTALLAAENGAAA